MISITKKWIQRILVAAGVVITIIFVGIFVLYIWIDFSVKENIAIAKQKYPGTAEDALIAYLLDENNSANSRTHLAIYTLGQIGSKKALPVIYKFYKNDPEGKICRGKHNAVLCQYVIHKAIDCIEKEYIFLHRRLYK